MQSYMKFITKVNELYPDYILYSAKAEDEMFGMIYSVWLKKKDAPSIKCWATDQMASQGKIHVETTTLKTIE